MIQLNVMDNVYVDEDLAGFTRKLKDDGVVERQVDLLVAGAAYAIVQRLAPLKTLKRHDLTRAATIHEDVRVVLETTLPWFARELRLDPPQSPKELLDLLARSGSAGLKALKGEWEALSPGQLRARLLGLAARSAQRS